MERYLYLLINVLVISVPLIYSFHPKILFYKRWNAAIPAILINAIVFIIWDELFTQAGTWSFNSTYLLGVYCFSLPVEEVFFFITIPYACLFTYYCLEKFKNWDLNEGQTSLSVVILSVLSLIIAIVFTGQLYTFTVFFLMAVSLSLVWFIKKVKWMGTYLWVYLVLLIPFLLVNGILTGMLTDQPVVIYNPVEIIGIRIITIPVEDFAYAFIMILFPVYLFKVMDERESGETG